MYRFQIRRQKANDKAKRKSIQIEVLCRAQKNVYLTYEQNVDTKHILHGNSMQSCKYYVDSSSPPLYKKTFAK